MRALLDRTLPPGEVAPSLARNALQEVPRLRGDLDRLRLMVSELVTNSVRHAHLHRSDEIQLLLLEKPNGIRVEVKNPGDGYEAASKALANLHPRSADAPPSEGGFGLILVAVLADRLGARRDRGTIIWFEIDDG
jgi:anti-sigma regulatory factor (Ser/Thr protein kinase)